MLNILSRIEVRDLSRDNLQSPRSDQVHSQPERYGMKEELVHDHVHDHDDGELQREEDPHGFGVLRAGLEREDSVQERRGQKVHG